jgi:hypothetical protein
MIGLLIGRKGARFDVTDGVDRTGRARAANVLHTF